MSIAWLFCDGFHKKVSVNIYVRDHWVNVFVSAGEIGDPADRVIPAEYKGDKGAPGRPGIPGLPGLSGRPGLLLPLNLFE